MAEVLDVEEGNFVGQVVGADYYSICLKLLIPFALYSSCVI